MYTIAQWEEAKRPEVEFNEIYLKEGKVNVVIGTVMIPYKNKDAMRIKKVRWNHEGVCMDENGIANELLAPFNIELPKTK